MKRKPSLFSRLGQIVLAMALLSGLSVGISACARNNITTLADRTPKLAVGFLDGAHGTTDCPPGN